jgi:putative MATE family efflux protein
MVLTIAVPMMVQNGISNFVNLLDNLMIGRVGTNALSGVAIANQIMFVYYLLIFGATAGVGIFTAQYYGLGDVDGVRETFRFKIVVNILLSAISIMFLYLYSEPLIGLFLKGEGAPSDAAETLSIGLDYMHIMLIGLIPVGICNAYAGTLKDIGQTKVPMIASFAAILVNLAGNALLIYGLLGFPALGAAGAAIATVISRFVELGILVVYTASHKTDYPFIIGAFKNFSVPLNKIKKYVLKSLPLVANESLWAFGTTTMNQCYSFRSLEAVAALNIQSTIWNLMGVSFLAMGEAVGIVVGQILGSGNIERAKDHARKMIAFTIFWGVLFGIGMVIIAPYFPLLYKTSDSIRSMAASFIVISGIFMPVGACLHASYFTIRSGGNTVITMLFDSCFMWVLCVPTAFILSRYTDLSVFYMLLVIQSLDLIKCLIGILMVRSGIWAKNIVK